MTVTQYLTATTLDGFIADAHNSLDWLFKVAQGEDAEQRWEAFIGDVGVLAMGATTYAWVLEHEDLLSHPERWRAFYGDRPCWVFTHRELPAIPGTDLRFVSGDVAPVHAEMVAAAAGRNVWLVGGGELVGRFHDAGLLDEVRVSIAPVTLGVRGAAAAPPDRGAVPARGAPQRRLRRSRVRRRVPARAVPAGPGVRGSSAPDDAVPLAWPAPDGLAHRVHFRWTTRKHGRAPVAGTRDRAT